MKRRNEENKEKTTSKGMHKNLATKLRSSRINCNFLTEALIQGPRELGRMLSADFFWLQVKSLEQSFLFS